MHLSWQRWEQMVPVMKGRALRWVMMRSASSYLPSPTFIR